MLKIDIASIREVACNLIALNDGYLMYQNKQVINYNLLHDSTLNYDYIIEGDFQDVGHVILYVGTNTHGNCKCQERGLCKHEIALYFILRDMVSFYYPS